MKAAIATGNGIEIRDVPKPACGDDNAVVRVHRSALCNATDVEIANGTFPEGMSPEYPHILGHECAGEVVEVGKNVTGLDVQATGSGFGAR